MVRYSTTLAVNRLIERKGPRLGLFTTEDFEDTLSAGRGGSWGDGIPIGQMRNLPKMKKPEPVILRHMIVGVKERIDYSGKVVRPLDEEDALAKLRYLVNQGAQGFVVCLINSYANPVHEQKIRDLIRRQYPESYLGSQIVVLSSDVSPRWREYPRMVATMLCAYLHRVMVDELKGMGDELRGLGYKKALMMVHNSGGMAEVFRTTALNTFNGGPDCRHRRSRLRRQGAGVQQHHCHRHGGHQFRRGTDCGQQAELLPVPSGDRPLGGGIDHA